MAKKRKTRTMSASSFRKKFFAAIRNVQKKRDTIIITKRGKPVAKLVPVDAKAAEILGYWVGKGRIVGDVVSPAISPNEWGDLA